MFGLNQQEIQNGYINAEKNPYVPDTSAGFFDGALTALPKGFEQGGAEAALFFMDKENEQAALNYINSLKPDPKVTGWLGNVLQGVGSIVPEAAVGTALTGGNPIGGALAVGEMKGYAARRELESKGVDANTATNAGIIEGIAQGAGVVAPASVGGNIATRVATGAGINIGIGGIQRGATGKILEDNGYTEMADQYRVLDGMAMMTDAIIGGAFGALHTEGARTEPLPSHVDAALAANNIHQLEIESAPGIPADIATRNAHVQAMDAATEQLLNGEPVDVGLDAVSFLPKHENTEITDSFGSVIQENELTKWERESVGAAKVPDSPFKHLPKEPIGITDWIKQNGGLRDDGGDIRHTLGGAKYRPGLISKKGKSADELAMTAWEAGYFPEKSERPTANELLDRLSEDLSGNRHYSHNDREAAADYHDSVAYNAEVDRLANQYGIETKGKTKADFWDELSGKLSEEQRDTEALEQQSAMDAQYALWEQKAREWHESRGDAWEPEPLQSRTLEDLENEYRQENTAGILPESNEGGKASPREGNARPDSGRVQEGGDAREDGTGSAGSEKLTQEIISENPDLKITDENGEVVSAKEAMDKADAEIAQAKKDKGLFEAAVNCFIRNGDA